MNNEAARILLAEWQGWVPHDQEVYPGKWIDPNGNKFVGCFNMPEPHEDANDCNDLITFLNGKGYVARLDIHDTEAVVMLGHINKRKQIPWATFDNWLHGVCDLAVKIRESKIGDG